MKKQSLVRILTLLLVLCMSVTVFAACKKDKTPQETQPQDNTPTNKVELPAEALQYMPEAKDLGGYEFRMYLGLFEDDETVQYFKSAAGLGGDEISQALWERNEFIESTYNCTIKPKYTLRTDASQRDCYEIITPLDAHEDFCDVIIIAAGDIMQKNIQRGDVIDLLQLENLNLKASYWDQSIQKDYAVNGKVFALQGDYTIQDELATSCVFYNGMIWDQWADKWEEDLGFTGTPYDLVRNNEWTFEMMLKMLKGTSQKKDGVTFTENDVYGMFMNLAGAHTLLLGTGLKTLTVEDGQTVITMEDNTTYNRIFSALNDIIKNTYDDNEEILISGTPRATGIITTKSSTLAMFKDNQALFIMDSIGGATGLRDMTSAFGILPIPQYYEDQTEYYCWCPNGNMPMTVPRTVVEYDEQKNSIDAVSTIMELMAFYSRYSTTGGLTLYEAFYDKMTATKVCRTGEDYEMMELIYYSKAYDLDCAAGLSRVYHLSHYLELGADKVYYGPNCTGSSGPYYVNPSFSTLRSNLDGLRSKVSESVTAYVNAMEDKYVVVP